MILIIGRGFIGSGIYTVLKERHGVEIVSHAEDWQSLIAQKQPKLIVNAAGIVGQKRCREAGWDAVRAANINLAVSIGKAASAIGSRCLLFSTGSVYAAPHSTPKPESAACYTPNLYIHSKIVMEASVESAKDITIFRIPSVFSTGDHKNDYLNRIQTWKWVQSCYTSPLKIKTLATAVSYVATHKVRGVFNIAESMFVYLPAFVEQHYKRLPIEEKVPVSFTQAHLLDTTKAQKAGVL